MARVIPLTQGLVSIVDDEDYRMLSGYRWHVVRIGRVLYAGRLSPRVYMHRFILGLLPGDSHVDHINHDGLDNRRQNLRLASKGENQANSRKHLTAEGCPPTSRLKGVSWNKKRECWEAQIMLNGRNIHLGLYESEDIAAAAYAARARDVFGTFAETEH